MIETLLHSVWYLVEFILHLDVHLGQLIEYFGAWAYGILFLIIFAETGLVVTPILPGDSLLFAAGAFAATGVLRLDLLLVLLTIAAILGDGVNYSIGSYLGPKALHSKSRFLKPEYLAKTQRFYEKYGSKTIVIARFVPIVRTFAPFMAGVGKMSYSKFGVFNIAGGVLWIFLFLLGGYFFGNLPMVRKNFTLVILAIIVLSVAPAIIEIWRERRRTVDAPVKDAVRS